MKLALLLVAFAAFVAAAGYLGMAPMIAQGFKVLTFLLGAGIILGSIAGGIRVSGRRSVPQLMSRIRRHAV